MDSIGGAQTHVRDLATYFTHQGHFVTVFGGGSGPLASGLLAAGVQVTEARYLVRPVHPIKDIMALFEIIRFLREQRPNIVACHSSKAGLLGRIAACVVGGPAVFTAHGWAFSEGVPPYKRRGYILAEKMASFLTQKIITVSQYDYRLAQRCGIDKKKLVCVHNGVHGIPKDMSEAHPGQDPVRICMVARFDQPKDHLILIRALSSLMEYNWHLDLVGDGPLQNDMEATCRHMGIFERITFQGYRSDIPSILKKAQLFVLTSKWEGFPCSILEAMRAGLPVVASDVGGVSESVQDTVNGFLVPRGDVDALTDRLKKLISNPGLREDMGRNGRKIFEDQFSFTKMADRTLAVYHEAIAAKQKSNQK
jgi:glycosyltransferase involved in cell wall biosynthesis